MRRSRGISSEMFFRLWTRAPWTATVVRAVAARVLEAIRWFAGVEEGKFLDLCRAHPGQAHRRRDLRQKAPIGEVFAGGRDAAHIVRASKIIVDVGRRPRVPDVAEV